MAVTSIWAVKGWLGKVVIYAEDPNKTENPDYYEKREMTEEQAQGLSDVIDYASRNCKTQLSNEQTEVMRHFVTGINCEIESARDEMIAVKKHYGKTEGIVAFHGYQSFAPGETTPETAHEIGVKLAERLWGEKHQVLIATHLDKGNHLHNHFVLNNVSMIDGKKYYRSERDYWLMQRESDNLCREYELSVIENPKRGQTKHYTEWQAEQEGRPTIRGFLKAEIDEAISQSMNENQFVMNLRRRGFEVKLGKYVSVRPPGNERFSRLHTKLGDAYTRQGIIEQMRGRRPTLPEQERKRTVKKVELKGNLKTTKKLTGFRALYFYYLYLLGKIPKKRPKPPSKVHYLFREDLIKIDRISNEVKLLYRHQIDTSEQLFSYKAGLTERMEMLTTERADLRKQLQRSKDEPAKEELKAKILILTKGLGEVRKDVGLCDDIAERTTLIKEKRQKIREEHKEQDNDMKEKDRYESFR